MTKNVDNKFRNQVSILNQLEHSLKDEIGLEESRRLMHYAHALTAYTYYSLHQHRIDLNEPSSLLAEDIVQNALLKYLQRRLAFQGEIVNEEKEYAYLRHLCRNEMLDYFRRSKRTRRLNIDVDDTLAEDDAFSPESYRDRIEELLRFGQNLRPAERQVLELMILENMSADEIAVRLSKAPQTIRSIVSRIRTALRSQVIHRSGK